MRHRGVAHGAAQGQATRAVKEDHAPRGPWLGGRYAAHFGPLQRCALGHGLQARRQAQQLLHIARGLLGAVGGQRQPGQVTQDFRVLQQLAAVLLGLGQRLVELVAGLQRPERGQVEASLLGRIGGAGLRGKQRVGRLLVVAACERR